MVGVSIIYLSTTQAWYMGKLQELNQSGQIILGIILTEITYLLGPFGLTYIETLVSKVFYRVLFFATAFSNIIYIILGSIFMIYLPDDYMITCLLIITIITAPFKALFYCTYNYYVNSLCQQNNKGVYFGLAYSLLCTSTFFSAIILYFTLNESFMIPYTYQGITIGVALVSSIFYWLVKEKTVIHNETPLDKHLLRSFSKIVNVRQTFVPISFDYEFGKLWKCIYLPNMYYMIINFAQTGLLNSYKFIMTNIMIRTYHGDREVSNVKLLIQLQFYYGIGQFLGGISSGMIGDLTPNRLNKIIYVQFITLIAFIQAVFNKILNFKLQKKQILATYYRSDILLNTFFFFIGLCQSAQETSSYSYVASRYYNHPQILALCNWLYCYGIGIYTFIFSCFLNLEDQKSLYIAQGFVIFITILNLVLLMVYQYKEMKNTDRLIELN